MTNYLRVTRPARAKLQARYQPQPRLIREASSAHSRDRELQRCAAAKLPLEAERGPEEYSSASTKVGGERR